MQGNRWVSLSQNQGPFSLSMLECNDPLTTNISGQTLRLSYLGRSPLPQHVKYKLNTRALARWWLTLRRGWRTPSTSRPCSLPPGSTGTWTLPWHPLTKLCRAGSGWEPSTTSTWRLVLQFLDAMEENNFSLSDPNRHCHPS